MNSFNFAFRGLICTILFYGCSSLLNIKQWITPTPIFDFFSFGLTLFGLFTVIKAESIKKSSALLVLSLHSFLHLLTSPWLYTFFNSSESAQQLIDSSYFEILAFFAGISLSSTVLLIFYKYSKPLSITVTIMSLVAIFVFSYKLQYMFFALVTIFFFYKKSDAQLHEKIISKLFIFYAILVLLEFINTLA